MIQRGNLAIRLRKETGQNEGNNLAVRAQIQRLARARFGLPVMMGVKRFWNRSGSGNGSVFFNHPKWERL